MTELSPHTRAQHKGTHVLSEGTGTARFGMAQQSLLLPQNSLDPRRLDRGEKLITFVLIGLRQEPVAVAPSRVPFSRNYPLLSKPFLFFFTLLLTASMKNNYHRPG